MRKVTETIIVKLIFASETLVRWVVCKAEIELINHIEDTTMWTEQ